MTLTLNSRAKRVRIVLAAAAAIAALGIGSTVAAPPSGAPTFVSASISIEQRGEAEGDLFCKWRETGLGSSQVVNYRCAASKVIALKACVNKNRIISDSPTRLDIFNDVSGGVLPFFSQKSGQISASVTTSIPTPSTAPDLCNAPAEEAVVAVRWCNASLTDVTNNLAGATLSELFQQFFSGVGPLPSCSA